MRSSACLDHVTIVSDDFESNQPFYHALLTAIGLVPTADFQDPEEDTDDSGTVAAVGYADPDGQPVLWLAAGLVTTSTAHVALRVVDRAQVDSAFSAAVAAGGRVVQAPREWESAHLNYFGCQLSDHSGNIIEVLFRQL
jgi:catechol 2,3-dioxygenase-like lactoylglutathione lyase family enzyme